MMRPRVLTTMAIQHKGQIRVIDAREAANRLGLSIWTIYACARAGRIPSLRLGPRRLFLPQELDQFIADSRVSRDSAACSISRAGSSYAPCSDRQDEGHES